VTAPCTDESSQAVREYRRRDPQDGRHPGRPATRRRHRTQPCL